MTRRLRGAPAALLCCAAIALVGASAAAADEVSDFSGTWADRALGLQYELGSDMPLHNAPFVGTHNSFNSVAEMGQSLSAQDSNQKLDIVDQLDIDVRSIELDLHRVPTANGLAYKPTVCHALEGGGCTTEKQLGPILQEISGWLREPDNSDQVLLLYLEDDLDTEGTHDDAADAIDRKIGDLVYRPPGGGCTEVPDDVTRDQVREAGKQVIIVSGCGTGDAWQSFAYSWIKHRESRPFGFEDYPSCGPDYDVAEYDARLIRYYEDSTRLAKGSGTADDGITPATAAAMARCGVDLLGLDQLIPLDGRLANLVWSWAADQPADGTCALTKVGSKFPYGRWFSTSCKTVRRPVACKRGKTWLVPRKPVSAHEAAKVCRQHDAHASVPRTGYENELLRDAMTSHDVRSALLGYRMRQGVWVPLDPRG